MLIRGGISRETIYCCGLEKSASCTLCMFSHRLDFAESLEREVNILIEEVFRCIIFEKVSKIEGYLDKHLFSCKFRVGSALILLLKRIQPNMLLTGTHVHTFLNHFWPQIAPYCPLLLRILTFPDPHCQPGQIFVVQNGVYMCPAYSTTCFKFNQHLRGVF